MEDLYRLHPIAVHFPIAILIVGWFVALGSKFAKSPAWIAESAPWFLWTGTLSAWAALGLGLLAQKTAPHVPPAWETLAEHKELGFWTCGLFTALSIWRILAGRRREWILIVLWLVAVGVLAATADHGGDLVYEFGMGVGR